ncbi:hypothetical protein COV15_02945 [Candidatus Woesearchaeota archaeon CG10_big_fil_rev_8_21_14_0_10_34_12]|nr:MAG: hypothetical protein COV15_02945 [Candidatus Woesearchaeota archaeon CG10_big_fil_rev_8_21_14_0_10_34_12]
MGKNRVMSSLGSKVGNLVAHKILTKHTNRLESISHSINEAEEYEVQAVETAKKFNWNDDEINEIKLIAKKEVKKIMERKYPDIKFPADEADNLISETIEEVIG